MRLQHMFVFAVLMATAASLAQTSTSGGLTGVITDQSNALVPNAGVQIKESEKGVLQTTTTDQQGVYHFFFVSPGKYELTVWHDGFRGEKRAVTVPLGPPVSVNVKLEVAEATTSVEVTAEAPLIHAENGDVSTTMSTRQISEVPNPGNDLTYIAQTAPGAIMNTDNIGVSYSGNFSILGMPGTAKCVHSQRNER